MKLSLITIINFQLIQCNIEYIKGDCENAPTSIAYDYNLTLNTADFCALCFQKVIDILK